MIKERIPREFLHIPFVRMSMDGWVVVGKQFDE
jgi:hypothetical protein